MREPQKVILHYLDKTLLPGHARFFFRDQQRIDVTDLDGRLHTVDLDRLKAVFFVKDFEGDSNHAESRRFVGNSPVFGEPIRIVFSDGEILLGRALGYRPEERGFYVQPADPHSNNRMVFVPVKAVREIQVGEIRLLEERP